MMEREKVQKKAERGERKGKSFALFSVINKFNASIIQKKKE